MHMPKISISECDFIRLKSLLAYDYNAGLESELNRAEIINSILVPPTLVTMESTVLYIDHDENTEKESLLVYSPCPLDQDQVISVLSPVGTALLGLEAGDKILWMIDGREKLLEVIDVTNQPEAGGILHPLTFRNEFQQTYYNN